MQKSEYINRFNISLNYVSKEAFIRFINETPVYDNEYKQTGVDQNEIANIVLTEHNARDLHRLLGDLLQKMDQWLDANKQ